MLRKNLGLYAFVVGSLFAASAVTACGGDDDGGPTSNASGGTSGGGGSSGSSGSSGTGGSGTPTTGVTCDPDPSLCVLPPEAPAAAPPAAGTTETVLAVSNLYLGTTDRSGNSTTTAWKDYGFNLDNLISKKTDTNHCKPQQGANPSTVKTDGNGGIDNSFGANLMPLISSLASSAQDDVNQSITDGSFTVMVRMTNLGDPATDQTAVNAMLYGGADMGSAPKWDGTDAWPVFPELLNGGNIDDPKVKFPASFVAGGTWVSNGGGSLDLTISIQGFSLTLTIVQAVFAMDITGTGATAAATNGTIAGVLETENLINELKKVAGAFDESLCEGSTFESIAQQIRAASDIMGDGTNGDDTKTCNAISIGLGFDAKAVVLGAVAAPATGGEDPCAGAGG